MKAKGFNETIEFLPDNTNDAFLLGRLYEKTAEQLKPGISVGSDGAIVTDLLGIRFDAAELVDYLLRYP